MKLNKLIVFIVAAVLTNVLAFSQNDNTEYANEIRWQVGFNGGGSTGNWAPYLLGSNSGGRHAMNSEATVGGIIYKEFDLSKRFTWTAGIEADAGYQGSANYDRYDAETKEWGRRPWHPSRATLYQLWGGVKFRGVMLWAGMREHKSSIVDDALSSGDMVLSNNAHAIPQVEIGFVDYQNIPFTKGWVQINGTISYGKYADSNSLKGRYNYWNDHVTLGQLFTYKHVHFRTRQDVPFAVTIGVQAAGEFGGTTYKYAQGKEFQVIKNDENLRAFWEMFIPKSRYRDGFVEGNHVGTWEFLGRYRFKSGIELEGYFEWFWEDGSSMAKRNITDGLWGVALSFPGDNKVLKKVIAEYIDMRDQSGPIHWAPTDAPGTTIGTEATGGDNYYNSSGFNAWVNYGLALGNSFPKAPLYNSDGYPQFQHSRTRGFQLAANGCIVPGIDWTAKFSYGVAWGNGRIPYAKALKNTSALISAKWDAQKILRGLGMGGSLAFDAGNLRGNSFGCLFNVTYSGNFHF